MEDRVEPQGVLTLAQALQLAFRHHPGLDATMLEIEAAEARTLQASLYPNPQVDVEIENLAGSGPLSGIQGTESTVAISQSILLGNKRKKQVESAALESDLAAWQAERKRLDLYADVHSAFNQVLIAQEDLVLKQELLQLSEKLVETISQRIRAGKVSTAEASRAQVIQARNKISRERAKRFLAESRQRLAATWGSRKPLFFAVEGEYDLLFTLPSLDSLQLHLMQNPDLARFETEIRQRQAAIAVEEALAIPDPTVTSGVRHVNESGDLALVVGISIPLPVTNRNQGNREEARVNLTKSERHREETHLELSRDLSVAYNQFQAVHNEVLALKNEIIPQAENAYQRINEGYLQGRFDFLDVLDAQKTLFESKDRYLHALREFHETVVRIERLIAKKIH